MKIALKNFGTYITHFEDLAHTDSGWVKRAQIKVWLNLWKEANFPVNLSVYLDVLAPLRRLSLGLQVEKHDSVQHVRHIQELTWLSYRSLLIIRYMMMMSISHIINALEIL